jgi:BirA family biotin operon repressor/biotin-[acetyl-CoA-carboxylase] ligase
MDEKILREALPVNGLGEPLFVYEAVGSTNDVCRGLAGSGAPHGTLVVADEQLKGRGRDGRRWFTPPGSAIAMSLLLRPGGIGRHDLAALNMLGALAVVQALDDLGLAASIKWPNDVLLGGGKVAGVLTETTWRGEVLEYVVLGLGVNVGQESVPPEARLDFPAVCIEAQLGRSTGRESLVAAILKHIAAGIKRLGGQGLIPEIEQRLAYLGCEVEIHHEARKTAARVVGLSQDCRLRVQLAGGEERLIGSDAHLRAVD